MLLQNEKFRNICAAEIVKPYDSWVYDGYTYIVGGSVTHRHAFET